MIVKEFIIYKDTNKGKTSLDNYTRKQEASTRLREAKDHIKNIHTLYLPHPERPNSTET